jgi:hypothetical protein
MMDDYTKQSDEELHRHVMRNPPETRAAINARFELERRREEKLIRWTHTLAVSTIILVIATLMLVICTAADVYLHVHR